MKFIFKIHTLLLSIFLINNKLSATPKDFFFDKGISIETGISNNYFNKGEIILNENYWVGLNYIIKNPITPINIGFKYINGKSNFKIDNKKYSYNFIYHIITDLGVNFGFQTFFGYKYYFNYANSKEEFTLDIKKDLEVFNLISKNSYDYILNKWHHRVGIEKNIYLYKNSYAFLELGFDYSNTSLKHTNWNNYYGIINLSIEIKDNFVLTPYIGYVGGEKNWSFNNYEKNNYNIHGGIRINISF